MWIKHKMQSIVDDALSIGNGLRNYVQTTYWTAVSRIAIAVCVVSAVCIYGDWLQLFLVVMAVLWNIVPWVSAVSTNNMLGAVDRLFSIVDSSNFDPSLAKIVAAVVESEIKK